MLLPLMVFFTRQDAPELLVDVASIGRIRVEKRRRWYEEEQAEDRERLRMAVMAAVEAEKMAAVLREQSNIAPPQAEYSQMQMLPTKFRGRR